MPILFSLHKPGNFDFMTTVRSHGWYDLDPFQYDESANILHYVFQDANGRNPVAGKIYEKEGSIVVELKSSKISRAKIERDVMHLLRMDDDMSGFYSAVSNEAKLGWVSKIGAGRLLRSPTVFEDVVKTLCTTNCSWALTRKMVENLVGRLGAAASGGRNAFPTAEAMASKNESFYRNEIRAGYRSPYFVELANAVAGGELDPESWLHSELPMIELKKEIKNIKGFGDYAAENLLKLLGRYDGLALDSFLRGEYKKKYNRGRACTDKKIHKHYAKFGEWKGLVMWCDMTEDWFSETAGNQT
jgi:3-methyladenine DNA glycosylase/8-oxoguanine DNA glycosylase